VRQRPWWATGTCGDTGAGSCYSLGTLSATPIRPLAVLVGVQLPGVSDVDHASHLAELGRLARTLGYDPVATVTQRRDHLSAGTILGSGKLKELAKLTGGIGVVSSGAHEKKSKARERWEAQEGTEGGHSAEAGGGGGGRVDRDGEGESTGEGDGAEGPPDGEASADAEGFRDHGSMSGRESSDGEIEAEAEVNPERRPTIVVVDHELSPSQLSNLERATGARVLDRTGVIVDIFRRHARSREARMQVEIARLNYLAPRLRESTGSRERQQGRGAGDSAIELDRRKIRDRLAELRAALAAISKDDDHRRFARRDQLRVALVGYTNAGKSSLMRALTGSEVLVADQLFATLDTTVRALQPETRPRILVSDTVGFIQKLPHDLVASFRSTLEEAREASLLLYVVDASDPTCEAQLEVTRQVLREIGADDLPSLTLFNKLDALEVLHPARREALRQRYPDAVMLSAHSKQDVAALRQRVIDFFELTMVDAEFVIPYSRQARTAEVYEQARVLSETFDETGRRVVIRAPAAVIAKLARSIQDPIESGRAT
jgi:GTP-binding protein HflX